MQVNELYADVSAIRDEITKFRELTRRIGAEKRYSTLALSDIATICRKFFTSSRFREFLVANLVKDQEVLECLCCCPGADKKEFLQHFLLAFVECLIFSEFCTKDFKRANTDLILDSAEDLSFFLYYAHCT